MAETVLLPLAFLASGAWMVYSIPGQPIAQCLFVGTAAVWAAAVGLGFAPSHAKSKQILVALGALLVSVLISTVANPYLAQTLLYDVYGEMPLILWLCYPLMFFLAAGLSLNKAVAKGIRIVFFAGFALALFAFGWRWLQGFVTVFGSPAYATPALAPLVVLGLALAHVDPKRKVLYYSSSTLFALALLYAMGGALAFAALAFALVCSLFICPELLFVPKQFQKVGRIIGAVGTGCIGLASLIMELPVFASRILPLDRAATMGQTIATRVFLWDGAQKMFLEKPFFGYGPSGYRINAVEFYDARIFPFVSKLGGDPIAYSSPSPHSILWDILLRLGIVGMIVLTVLFVLWIREVRKKLITDDKKTFLLRCSLAIGFCVYLFSLLFTPVHFASALFGVVMGGLAIAPAHTRKGEKVGRVPLKSESGIQILQRVLLCICAALLLGFGVWKAIGLTQAEVDVSASLEENYVRAQKAARIIPGDPLNERHLLEAAIAVSETDDALHAAQKAVDDSPGYIKDYGPNLALFAQYSLNDAEITGRKDLSWEESLLQRAGEGYPAYPLLEEERSHLEAVRGK